MIRLSLTHLPTSLRAGRRDVLLLRPAQRRDLQRRLPQRAPRLPVHPRLSPSAGLRHRRGVLQGPAAVRVLGQGQSSPSLHRHCTTTHPSTFAPFIPPTCLCIPRAPAEPTRTTLRSSSSSTANRRAHPPANRPQTARKPPTTRRSSGPTSPTRQWGPSRA